MKFAQRIVPISLATVFLSGILFPALAGPKQTQQEATAASLAEAALLYNYGRKQNSTNGAFAIAGAAGTAYLWNKYGQERGAEKRQEQARLDYYRRRSVYYHKLSLRHSASVRHAR